MKEFGGKRSFFTPNNPSVEITLLDTPLQNICEAENSAENVKIVAVKHLVTNIHCVACSGSLRTDPNTPKIGHCTTCDSTMLVDMSRKSTQAILTLKGPDGQLLHLKAYGDTLTSIVGAEESDITHLKLLTAPPITIQHNGQRILTASRNHK